jgi:uncharacterized protein YegP (UPF0339 family)/predicted transcriptional regulator/predicted RNase H-like HicB family nuclease
MRVTAKAQRSAGWWAVEVPEVPGVFTQARRLDQIPEMVRDAVALVSGKEAGEIEIVVDPHTDMDVVVAEALAARAAATVAQEAAMDAYRDAAKRLSDAGLTVRDSGQLLGVSPQRVSQILEEAIAAVRSQAAVAQRAAARAPRAAKEAQVAAERAAAHAAAARAIAAQATSGRYAAFAAETIRRAEIYTDADGNFRYGLRTDSGEVILESPPFETRAAAQASADSYVATA